MDVQSLVTALMVWVSATGVLPMPDARPVVKFAPQEYLDDLYCTAIMDQVRKNHPELLDVTKCEPGTRGMHRYPVIYMPESWSPDNLFHISELLHETVHFMQEYSGQHYACRFEKERQAYKLQQKYVESTGADFFEITGYQRLSLMLQTGRCGFD